jgi:hypothetical protein
VLAGANPQCNWSSFQHTLFLTQLVGGDPVMFQRICSGSLVTQEVYILLYITCMGVLSTDFRNISRKPMYGYKAPCIRWVWCISCGGWAHHFFFTAGCFMPISTYTLYSTMAIHYRLRYCFLVKTMWKNPWALKHNVIAIRLDYSFFGIGGTNWF